MPKKSKKLRKSIVRLVKNDFFYDTVTFLLIILVLYLIVVGTMMIALRNDNPVRGVISNSMFHADDVSWRRFFEEMGHDTSKFPLQGGFEHGDMLIIQGVSSPSEISIGDVIVFDVPGQRIPLVHRVIEILPGGRHFKTKGDANVIVYPKESNIPFEKINGKAVFVIPKLGWFSLWWQGD